MDQVTIETPQARTVADAPPTCDRDGCTEPAVFSRKLISVIPARMPGFLHVVEFLLLFRREHRADLRHSAVHHRFHFLPGLPLDRSDLRLGLIDDRLNLGLLIGRQVQPLG